MQLQLTPYCICIHLSQTSSHYLHVKDVLTRTFERSFLINNVLINFALEHELRERKAFLASLYHVCAKMSQSSNTSFFQNLMRSYDKPIRLIVKTNAQHVSAPSIAISYSPYRLLNAHESESLESIRKKYLHLVKCYHPDRIVSKDAAKMKDSTAKFQQIQEAYETIKLEKMKKLAA